MERLYPYEPMEEESQQLLERLRSLGVNEALEVDEAPGDLGDPGDIFEMAARYLASGEPVYFTSAEERWVSFWNPADFKLHYARSSDELEYVRQIILHHKALVEEMLQGLDVAQRRLSRSS